jgi:hypothetical protein
MLQEALGYEQYPSGWTPINENEIQTEEQQEWRIESDIKADQVVEQVKRIRADLERKTQLAKEKKWQIDAWLEAEQEKAQGTLEYLEGKLKERSKTQLRYDLFAGRLKLKKQNPLIKRDDKAIIKWLNESGLSFVETEHKLKWGKLKEQLITTGGVMVYKDTGEIVPGIEVESRPDKFIVE